MSLPTSATEIVLVFPDGVEAIAVYDPDQPRWPGGSSGRRGGRFRKIPGWHKGLFEPGSPPPPDDVLEPATEGEKAEAEQIYVRSARSFTMNRLLRFGRIRDPDDPPSPFPDQERDRNDELYEQELRGDIQRMDRLMRRAGVKVRVTRYDGDPKLVAGIENAEAKGHEFTDLGFGSTVSWGRGRRAPALHWPTEWTLNVDPDVKVLWGANPAENELVLERGVRYQITDVFQKGDGSWHIHADVKPPR